MPSRNDDRAVVENELAKEAAEFCRRILASSTLQYSDRDDVIDNAMLPFSWFLKGLPLPIRPHDWQPWLRRTLHNKKVDRIRELVRERDNFERVPDGLDVQLWLDTHISRPATRSTAEDLEALAAAQRKLAPHLNQAISLSVSGQSVDEIAVAMGLSPKTIRLYLSQARRLLAAALR